MKIRVSLAAKPRIAAECELGNVVKVQNGKKNTKKKSCRRIKSSHVVSKMAIHILFDTCKEVFRGPGTIPPHLDVQKMRFVLDKIKPADVGLREDMPCFKIGNIAQGTPKVTYMHIYQCSTFSMGIFLLPPSATIPLHDHPGMTVFNKVLFGTMHLKAYDWVDDLDTQDDAVPSPQQCLARLKIDDVYTAPKTTVLFPAAGGNIHSLQAITPCAVLDVLGPPYSDGRDSTYYRDTPFSGFSGDGPSRNEDGARYGWLEVIEMPEDFVVDSAKYEGPQIFEDYYSPSFFQ